MATLRPLAATHFSLPANFYTATFLGSGHGHSHLALLGTNDIGTDPDKSDTQILETEEMAKKSYKILFGMFISFLKASYMSSSLPYSLDFLDFLDFL
jgi:hypothetical protein